MIAEPYFARIENASRSSDLFPEVESAQATYRRLARTVHPDFNPDAQERAHAAFARLSELWKQFNGAEDNDIVFTTRRHSHTVHRLLARGDIANIYDARTEESQAVLVKIVRNPANSELIANEITVLKKLKDDVAPEFAAFHSRTVDSFRHKDKKTGKDRRAIVLEKTEGLYSLREVLDAFPQGLDPRDLAWMARRLWVALGAAHVAGVAHGAVFPEHVLIHPEQHGLVLIDWCYAKEFDQKLTHGVPKYKDLGWYGSRFDQPLDHRVDVRQASHTLELMLGQRKSPAFRAFFKGCRVASAPPAGQLFKEFDELLEQLYGRRRFRPFAMPDTQKKGT